MKFNIPEQTLAPALIAESDIVRNLATIFEDSVILDGRFRIVMVSHPILRTLGYTAGALEGQSISCLGGAGEALQPMLQAALGAGFFKEIVVSLLTSSGQAVVFGLSGFYLGLISDYNGYIVLKLKNLDIVRQLHQQLAENRSALEDFVYRTSHDLRGPVANIRGLIHLLKNRPDDTELGLLADMLEASATRLDDRLIKLLYQADLGYQQPLPIHPATQP